jgi:TonB-dependent starch-binding outer membrane protein SusC
MKQFFFILKRYSRTAIQILNCVFLLFFYLPSRSQDIFSGTVTGTNGIPLSGATIAIKGSKTSVYAGADGKFMVTSKPGEILEITFVGYISKSVRLGEIKMLNISLDSLVVDLDVVLVTGYTSQKIKSITGSVASVKPKDLVAVPAGQVEQLLQGRVAGLNVITSGLPGSPSNVRIHGIGNFGDVTPLYIIDGVQGNINNLNPNDIESLQVLKDAGAYSIYGVRGANGVIIVTTRKGKSGKTRVGYDFYVGVTMPLNDIPAFMDPQEMADYTWIAHKNSGQVPSHPMYGNGANPILPDFYLPDQGNRGLAAGDPDADPNRYNIDYYKGEIYQIVPSNKSGTDWFHELYNPAFKQSHSLSFSGANEKNRYLFSLGYLDERGTLLNTWLKRYNARVNTEFSIAKNIRVGENLQWTYRDQGGIPDYGNQVDNDMFRSITTSSIMPVYDINRGWAHYIPTAFYDNPVALRTLAKDDKNQSWETFGNAYAELDFLKYFTARTSFGGGMVNYFSNRFDYWTYYPRSDSTPDNALTEHSGYRRSWTWTNTLKFTRTFDNDHNVTVLAGTEAINNYNRENGGRSVGLFSNNVNYRFLSNGTPAGIPIPTGQPNYSFASASTLFAYISQVDYGFREKYFLRGTLRRDGASFFGPSKRYGWFPSASVAWRISEENFLSESKWINELKVRASWGKSGFYGNTDPNNQYTLYGGTPADAYYDINGLANNAVQGFRTMQIGDSATGWQEDVVTNIGLETILWNGKFSVALDWYVKKANGLLFQVRLPDVLGGALPPNTNVGVVQNTGFDLMLGTKGRWSKNWSWDASLNLSVYNNRIKKLSDLPFVIPLAGAALGKSYVRNEVGYPISSFYGYQIIGIFQNQDEVGKAPQQDAKAPGRFRYLDANDDGKIDDNDRVHLGNANPDFTAGFNLGISYKNFDFTAFFYGSFGNEVVNVPKTQTDFYNNDRSAKSKSLLYDSWTPNNVDATIPIAELDYNFSNGQVVNSYVIEDGSYLRNKSMILGYILPLAWLEKNHIEKLRVYVQVANLFTITKYSGLDPELSGNSAAFGIDTGNFPNNQRQFLFGMNLNF